MQIFRLVPRGLLGKDAQASGSPSGVSGKQRGYSEWKEVVVENTIHRRVGAGVLRRSPQPYPDLELSGCRARVVAGNHPFLGVALLSNERIVRAVLLTPDNTPASVRALLYLGAIFGKTTKPLFLA